MWKLQLVRCLVKEAIYIEIPFRTFVYNCVKNDGQFWWWNTLSNCCPMNCAAILDSVEITYLMHKKCKKIIVLIILRSLLSLHEYNSHHLLT